MNINYVLFGATGNLAQIKIIPALFELYQSGILKPNSKIIAFGRRSWKDIEYRNFILPSLEKFEKDLVQEFLKIIVFREGNFEDRESFQRLKSDITSEKVFYHFAVDPEFYAQIAEGLSNTGLKGNILVEKPFGTSLSSAEDLEQRLESLFPEESIFRIDHYLGKGGVQEIIKKKKDLNFNSTFSNQYISKVVCRFREVVDIKNRGEFYDKVGAFRDVGQNHGLEIIATLLMDSDKDISIARADIIESFGFVSRTLVRGQYIGYRKENGVKEDSETETYFRLNLQSFNPNWEGVEIILEAGKALEKEERKEEIVVYYMDGTTCSFDIDIPKHHNAYKDVIEAAFQNDKTKFVGKREMFGLWQCADDVLENMTNIPLVYYKKGEGPKLIM